MPPNRNLTVLVNQFVQDISDMLRQEALEHIHKALGISTPSMPNRKPKRLAAPKTRPKRQLPSDGNLKKALTKVRKSKRPVTTKTLAKTLKIHESNARGLLSKLLRDNLVTAQTLGDGTRRKVYLPTKT